MLKACPNGLQEWYMQVILLITFCTFLILSLERAGRNLKVDLEGRSAFLPLRLSMHIDSLGLFSYLYGYLFNCITECQSNLAGAISLHMEVEKCYTVAISPWYSVHQLPGCECTVKRSL